jgi:hypothetical protein
MRWLTTLFAPGLTAPLLAGCGQALAPPASPSPPAGATAADRDVDDATEILKGINAALKSGGPAAEGVNRSVSQVGSHRVMTAMDVRISTVLQDEKAVLGFGGRTLALEFDQGRILLDGAETAKLPAGTKAVEVQFVGGKLSVTADGNAVITPGASQ